MAKNKGGSAAGSVSNRPAYARASFLFQAAALLAATPEATLVVPAPAPAATQAPLSSTAFRKGEQTHHRTAEPNLLEKHHHETNNTHSPPPTTTTTTTTASPPPLQGMARRLLTQMRAVARKTNMRLRPDVKHRVCKYCDTLLVEGATCVSTVENPSRNGRKPWADVLVVACRTCGRARRYPVTAPRQPRRPHRLADGGQGGGARKGRTVGPNAEAVSGDQRRRQHR
ncbi:RNAse P, Rpr2/Rpp21 subunit [Niveomyces insectorum RCEF 264]|uniref:RNAse P, Rpr2/Rpp21 subunit n=1 Tax=Niveomyces insectorum RCEF 264 TaxID=1081102 RepID=A0A167VDS9_9HYPO|nr:RNAse P, Rpr2/Rpp21 subunit [Niveomyces insectorum RCEF 264]